jgi:hypothetical protein
MNLPQEKEKQQGEKTVRDTEDHNPRSPNVVVKWVTLLLRIRKVPGSNFSPDTSYPD